MGSLFYYSSRSGNTQRFVSELGFAANRIPIGAKSPMPVAHDPFVLVCPTYADGEGNGAVPTPVIRFLNEAHNRGLLRGVIASGNRNFGETYALSGKIIAQKCQVPILYRFELAGTAKDIACVRAGLIKFWSMQCQMSA